MALSDELITKIGAITEISDDSISVSKIVAKTLPTLDKTIDASVGVIVSESVPANGYGNESIYEEAQLTVNVFARQFSRVEALTKAIVSALNKFSGTLTNIKVMQILMTSQRYRADPEDEIEISQIVFDIKHF